MRSRFGLFAAVLIALIPQSCTQKKGKVLTEGEIHYTIEYIGNFGVPADLLPKTLRFAFKKDKTLYEMSGIGNSGIANINNPEDGIYDTYFSLFLKRYYYTREPGEQFPGLESMKGIQVKKTSKTSIICGYKCKNAEVRIPSHDDRVREIWYTDEIRLKKPNASTPFSEIDGVLMSFFFLMGPVELKFDAESVFNKEVPEDTFFRRQNFTRVTKESINGFIRQMVNI